MNHSIEYWEEQAAYWRREIESNERLLRIMAWSPAVGLPLAVAAAFYHIPAGGLVAVATLVTVVTGVYMTIVRRFEFRASLRDSLAHIEEAREEAAEHDGGATRQ